jgi:hypothetical protein
LEELTTRLAAASTDLERQGIERDIETAEWWIGQCEQELQQPDFERR